jgi:ribosomal protein L7/L12
MPGSTSHNQEQLMPTQIPAEILKHWQNGHKIEAIKQLREQGGLGLKEAKDLLEASDEPDFVMAQQRRRRPCSSCASSWKNWA